MSSSMRRAGLPLVSSVSSRTTNVLTSTAPFGADAEAAAATPAAATVTWMLLDALAIDIAAVPVITYINMMKFQGDVS